MIISLFNWIGFYLEASAISPAPLRYKFIYLRYDTAQHGQDGGMVPEE